MVVFPEGMDKVKRQRWEWAQNIQAALDARGWSRKELVREIAAVYGLEVSLQAVGYWLNGDFAPNPMAQAALAGVFMTPHHLLFPPIQLERRAA